MKKFIIMSFMLISSLYAQSIKDTVDEQTYLIEEIKKEFLSLNTLIDELKFENENIKFENEENIKLIRQESIKKINNLEEKINSLKLALESNKEDESYILNELSSMSNQINEYKLYIYTIENKNKRNTIIVNILIPLSASPFIFDGLYDINNNNIDIGKTKLYVGLGMLIGLESIYQSGKFIFNLW